MAGLVANLSEEVENQLALVDAGLVPCLAELAASPSRNPEVRQDVARALANIAANEENHVAAYKQGAVGAAVALTESEEDATRRYAAMTLRFLSSHPEVRVYIVKEKLVAPFLSLASSDLLEFQRTGAAALASFTLSSQNRAPLVRQGGLRTILDLLDRGAADKGDLSVQRDAAFALANLADASDLQPDLLRENAVEHLARVAASAEDARVQRDSARAMACLTQSSEALRDRAVATPDFLPAVFKLARSLDVACQRYATLALCNLACGDHKAAVVEGGALRPLLFLLRFPDMEIQRAAALAVAALALGDHGDNKQRIVEEGALRPLVDMAAFPERQMRYCAALALCAVTLGPQQATKLGVARTRGLDPLLTLLAPEDAGGGPGEDCRFAAVYALGSLAENSECRAQLVEMDLIARLVAAVPTATLETKRAAAYLLARLAECVEFHARLAADGALRTIVALAGLEDTEAQECAAFALAHLASDRDLQVVLVKLGALRPLVAMMAVQSEPRHYAGLALLKLADNFENHVAIAQEGGIQALLRLGRERAATDQELQYKAALTVGALASSAVKMMPRNNQATTTPKMKTRPDIGVGAATMLQARLSMESKKAAVNTTSFLDKHAPLDPPSREAAAAKKKNTP